MAGERTESPPEITQFVLGRSQAKWPGVRESERSDFQGTEFVIEDSDGLIVLKVSKKSEVRDDDHNRARHGTFRSSQVLRRHRNTFGTVVADFIHRRSRRSRRRKFLSFIWNFSAPIDALGVQVRLLCYG
jgi:hypothetical protein